MLINFKSGCFKAKPSNVAASRQHLKSGCFGAKLTLAVLEMIVESAYDWESARVLPSVAVSCFSWEINPTMIADVVALVV